MPNTYVDLPGGLLPFGAARFYNGQILLQGKGGQYSAMPTTTPGYAGYMAKAQQFAGSPAQQWQASSAGMTANPAMAGAGLSPNWSPQPVANNPAMAVAPPVSSIASIYGQQGALPQPRPAPFPYQSSTAFGQSPQASAFGQQQGALNYFKSLYGQLPQSGGQAMGGRFGAYGGYSPQLNR